MVRKSKTLYEMLERRRTQGRAPAEGSGAKNTRRAEPDANALDSLRTSIGSVWSRLRGERPAVAPPVRWLISSPALAAVIFVCLGVGFGTGHWLIRPAAGGETQLRAAGRGSEPPGRLQTPPARTEPRPGIDLTATEEEKALSQNFYPLLSYSASQRSVASSLALYLREHGIDSARIRFLKLANGTREWVALVYAPEGKDEVARETLIARLKAVPPPSFARDFAESVKQLDAKKTFQLPVD